jgi:hypothetical protein
MILQSTPGSTVNKASVSTEKPGLQLNRVTCPESDISTRTRYLEAFPGNDRRRRSVVFRPHLSVGLALSGQSSL